MPASYAHRIADLRARACSCPTCRCVMLAPHSDVWYSRIWGDYRDPSLDERIAMRRYYPELGGSRIGMTNGGVHECPPIDPEA